MSTFNMKLKMFIMMGTILIVGLAITIWDLLLSEGNRSRSERKLFKKVKDPENEKPKLRLVK